MQTTISKWGNSQALRLPKAVVNQLYIDTGDVVEIDVKDNNIIIKPIKKKSQLDKLLAKMPDDYQVNEIFDDTQGVEVI
jgi:antitoxin MazE